MSNNHEKVCPNCGVKGIERTIMTGSVWVELGLLLLFILPGFIYSIVCRRRVKVCPGCNLPGMIPANSPRGRALIKEMGIEESKTESAIEKKSNDENFIV